MSEQGVLNVADFLLSEYAARLATQENITIDVAIARLKESAPLMLFRQFAMEYLSQFRPSAITHAEWNYIIQLANGKKFAISPVKTDAPGAMQPSSYLPVTGVETLREMQRNAQGMRGDMTRLGDSQSLSVGSPAVSFDQPGLFQRPTQ